MAPTGHSCRALHPFHNRATCLKVCLKLMTHLNSGQLSGCKYSTLLSINILSKNRLTKQILSDSHISIPTKYIPIIYYILFAKKVTKHVCFRGRKDDSSYGHNCEMSPQSARRRSGLTWALLQGGSILPLNLCIKKGSGKESQ